jgi:POT family proton-dependent oligopeptide transporter
VTEHFLSASHRFFNRHSPEPYMSSSTAATNQGGPRPADGLPPIFGHQAGLFLLFFTEMWERFSYYGMRALLVLFLVSELAAGGWGWSREDALMLYGWYTLLVYLTPILGGIVADKLTGHRNAVLLGALLMTLGHASMAVETQVAFYVGLLLLIIGNGFFKPNISSIVGQLYAKDIDKKDGAYTIFYMGINAGAFLGILLCGYVGEKAGWSYGFGLAGIFMCLGMIMFYLGQSILGSHGTRATARNLSDSSQPGNTQVEDPHVVKDRLIVIGILSFFTIFFWMAFEQAGGSMTIFAKDYTGRVMSGGYAAAFFWSNTFLTVVPLAVVTFVLAKLVKATFSHIPISNIVIVISFIIVWAIALWMLAKEFRMRAYEVNFNKADSTETMSATIQHDQPLEAGQQLYVIDLDRKAGAGKLRIVSQEQADQFEGEFAATVVSEIANETEIPASWFGILNSFFIIAFAPLFGRIWESKLNPSAPVKFGLGLILLGLGFGVLAIGSMGIKGGQEVASVSIWWLVLAYWFHTAGELCVSPVGLSYVSKLAPLRFVGLMFGVWFFASGLANFLAGWTGSYIDLISENYGLTAFFLIYTLIPIVAGLVICSLNGYMKRKMHGVE